MPFRPWDIKAVADIVRVWYRRFSEGSSSKHQSKRLVGINVLHRNAL